MKIEVINHQKVKRVNIKKITGYITNVLSLLNLSSKKVSILLCDDACIRNLNSKFLNKNSTTDVISFPLNDEFEPDYLGEVVVSIEAAAKVSKRYKNRWEEEVMLYIIHGILHLAGFNDQTEKQRKAMQKKEKDILTQILH